MRIIGTVTALTDNKPFPSDSAIRALATIFAAQCKAFPSTGRRVNLAHFHPITSLPFLMAFIALPALSKQYLVAKDVTNL